MPQEELKITQRDLPHWEFNGAVYFITFKTRNRLELTPAARQIVLDACLFFHGKRYDIFVLVVMPDHVHMLIHPLVKEESQEEYWSVSSIMHSIKSYSAKQILKIMTNIGKVWQSERYDRIVRNDLELTNVWEYIRQNPVKAGLSDSPEDYPFFWQDTELQI
ncbi:MAG: transposase [Okeania sp. SIO3B5]|uniref:REP-associated tyrosine transposase n=1 Tax=Okeania sp. SIO3B5 TaxID=2607811 RepID=UPI0013FEDEB7|nr:transposase [Okeania sp. SIO3B5]NEO56312.1 transposase [Okeania sp. SIO3B5]